MPHLPLALSIRACTGSYVKNTIDQNNIIGVTSPLACLPLVLVYVANPVYLSVTTMRPGLPAVIRYSPTR